MALRKQRGRSQAGDNAVVGSQTTSFERTTSGSAPPVELVKWMDNPSVGNALPTNNPADDIQAGVVTLANENTKVGG